MTFFDELKQRKVFRVAAGYLVVAWLLVQVAATLAPQLQLPEWAPRLVTLILMIGFPVALVMAWALDVTPEGIRVETPLVGNKRVYAAAASLLVLAIAWYVWHKPAPPPVIAAAATPVATTPERSIAVLPFVNMSGDPNNEYFSDGLAETTLDMLAQVPDLKVIARTSSFAFKGKAQDMRQIGAALGAAHLLEGSVQQAGETLRITVQLIKVADGSHLWSRKYDRPMVDLFKIQDEIASQVVQELAIALPAKQQQHLVQKRTDNIAAYQEYLKGIALLPGRKVAEMRVAAEHFEKAIALDPNYARAYSAAADTYNLLGQYHSITDAEELRAAGYVARALALAPDLGEAHVSRAAWLENIEDDPAGAEPEYRRGIELAPSYATGFQWYGELLGYRFGRHEEALVLKQRSVQLDPLSPIVLSELISTTASVGRYQEADRLLAKLHADYPDFSQGYENEAYIAADEGDLVRTLRAVREMAARDPDALGRARASCLFLIRYGALAEAGHCIDSAAANQALAGPDLPTLRAWQTLATGDVAGAQALIDQMPHPDSMLQARVLMAAGRNTEALAIFRRRAPELFAPAVATLRAGQVNDASVAGILLLRTGAQAQGRALLRQALQAWSSRPALMDTDQWHAVVIHAALGDKEQAITALKRGVAQGFFIDLVALDIDSGKVGLSKDPRYQQILAPARAKAAAQVEAARKAGLL